jgi:formamidopyrimidine-DNA glycosylase
VPELPEVESYRRLAEAAALGRPIAGCIALDAWYLKGDRTSLALDGALVGNVFWGARRRGKLLLLDVGPPEGDGPHRAGQDGNGQGDVDDTRAVLGLRFGMTGRLLVDGRAGVDELWYSSPRDEPGWDRFTVVFADGGDLRMRDPRRLGGVQLDPDEDRLGPDALDVSPAGLRQALAGSAAPLKARLLDQGRLAGVGNLAADETLWRAGLSPLRPAGALTPAELRRLHRHLRATLGDFLSDGGSHTGRLMEQRQPGGHCPRDGTTLVRATVGGRTTWWCPHHQV